MATGGRIHCAPTGWRERQLAHAAHVLDAELTRCGPPPRRALVAQFAAHGLGRGGWVLRRPRPGEGFGSGTRVRHGTRNR